ncbi:FtsX-like permease family protein [Actinokineospora auranticolor]|uniref:Putative ABC transport system permease protein n=1 Tax=Actinokineospora auranticolor TaxID=155976 RepID=A0A2S6H0Y3_9PSEU|nr:ABC transporter permease [Actinokineospora auranticolor]PPK71138.1 putative ABC transport system permease protein [Actinokineospora auranticolor]
MRYAVRAVVAAKARYVLPAIGIVLGVAFVVSALVYGEAVRAMAERDAALADVSVEVGPDRTETPLDSALVRRLAQVPGVAGVRPIARGWAFLVDREGGTDRAAATNYLPSRHTLDAGQAPQGANEVVLDDKAGYSVGDRVRIVVNGVVRDVRVSGTTAASRSLIVLDTATARKDFAAAPDAYTEVDLVAAAGTSESALLAAVKEVLPDEFGAVSGTELAASAQADAEKITEILLGFAAIALFVACFLIANTFTMLSTARARENALLRAIGASRRAVLRRVLAEAAVLGVIATVPGYVVGIGGAALLGNLFSDGPPLQALALTPILVALCVGLGVTVVAAYLPARRAAAIPPIAALRTGLPVDQRSLNRRSVVGAISTAAGLAAICATPQTWELIYLGAPLLMLGLIALTPWLGLRLTALIRRPLTRLAGPRATLAVENARRVPRRTAATANALMVGLAICAAATVPLASLAAEAERAADTGDTADLRITPVDFAALAPDTAARVAAVPGVRLVSPVGNAHLDLGGGRALDAAVVDPVSLPQFVPVTVRAGVLGSLDHAIAVTTETATRRQWAVGTRVSTYTVAAIVDLPAGFGHDALVASDPDGQPPASILVRADPGQADAVRDRIRAALDNPTVRVHTRTEYREAAAEPYRRFLGILYALLGAAVLIGALAVATTMTMSTVERTREVGLLRAIGMTRAHVRAAFRWESVVVALLAAVVGLPAGVLIGSSAVWGQDSVALAIPWPTLGLFVVLTAIIGVVAAAWPAWRASRLPVLDALRSDTE